MGKKYENGLVLGKFMPPQNGHLYLIDTAASQCKTLHVMVCSDETQPIPGELRYKWLREIYKNQPNIRIIWCKDPNPQYPNECDTVDNFYKKYWVPSVYKRIRKLDVVFTSEEYGDEFGRYLGVPHVQVDQPRSHYAVSATNIRTDPYTNWKYIPRVVRPYYTKKVVVMGPESVGKSTLIKKLAVHYDTYYVEEYGRTYTEISGTHSFTNQDFINIAEGHIELIDKAVNKGEKVIFIDTEAMVTKIFGEMYLGNEFDPTELNKIIKKQKFDLYLLLDIDVPWVDDGTRDFPHKRTEHFERIKKELADNNIPYVLISGDYTERFEKAVKEVDKLGYLY
jgi:HTH-type transcriptional repressor of NAD biosynthesis genes